MVKEPHVIQLVPYDGIGGVESAAKSLVGRYPSISVEYIYDKRRIAEEGLAITNRFSPLWQCVRYISQKEPRILVMSLWRSCVVGLLVKLLRPKTKLVLFIHNSKDEHIIDWLITRMALLVSTQVWADSDVAMCKRSHLVRCKARQTISFLVAQYSSVVTGPAKPTFIFWGRLSAQKNIARALEIFKEVYNQHQGARFTIVGPDCGELSHLRDLALRLGVNEGVEFIGPKPLCDIIQLAKNHSFYLQTSDYEGMAVSVVEAMQFGLVPIVTPAGEIRRYCKNDYNAILVSDNGQASSRVVDILSDDSHYRYLKNNAIMQWRNGVSYAESFSKAAFSMLGVSK